MYPERNVINGDHLISVLTFSFILQLREKRKRKSDVYEHPFGRTENKAIKYTQPYVLILPTKWMKKTHKIMKMYMGSFANMAR